MVNGPTVAATAGAGFANGVYHASPTYNTTPDSDLII